jgi:metal-responsive CopG/Arc/MetJ family transcriptional regulator
MEVNVDIDEELLREFDQAARAHSITRSVAVRGAITAWLSQARRDAALRELFETGFDPESSGGVR